nr:ribonuclease H-like domain-containing protein [Tanacetum cinerariifolium]
MDKCKTGLGYSVVPPPYTGNFMPPKPDLVYPSLDDFVDVSESVVEKPTVESNEPNTGNQVNVVKASACQVWRPKHKVLDHVSKNKGASMSSKRFDYVDAQVDALGTRQEIDPILQIMKKLMEDLLPLEKLKFNLFNVSRMCDKKNSVLFTDTACVVLSSDFKLTDESIVLLKVTRKDNMYSVDLKNVVPQGGLTCLFAKATSDESTIWHRRLGHDSIAKWSRRKENKTLIKAAKTILAGSKLPITLWTKAVYTSCIEQFWTTVKAKNINGEAQIHVKVDGKKVIISEASIRRDLRFGDEGGVNCFSNEVIFKQLTLIGSTMASAIICLAINQKFNFSKYILESMVKHLDSRNKLLMYLRFVQIFLNNQLKGVDNHTRTYVMPSHTKNVLGNMRRVGKDFSGKITSLFPTMMVQAQEEIGEGSAGPTDSHHTPIIIQPLTSQPLRKYKSRKPKTKDTELPQTSVPTEHVANVAVNEEIDDNFERATTIATSLNAKQDRGNIRVNTPQSGDDSLKLTELMQLCTNLQQRVFDLENTKTSQA